MSIGSLSSKYKVSKNIINYLTALIDKHGIGILRTDKNRIHTKFEKQEAIDRVLINSEASSIGIKSDRTSNYKKTSKGVSKLFDKLKNMSWLYMEENCISDDWKDGLDD